MDPTANLKEQLELAHSIIIGARKDWTYIPDPVDSERLADLVISLHGWIKSGGFLPDQWTKPKV